MHALQWTNVCLTMQDSCVALGCNSSCAILQQGGAYLEHMPQVATAVLASDLNALHAKGIVLVPLHSVGQVVIKRWPTTA